MASDRETRPVLTAAEEAAYRKKLEAGEWFDTLLNGLLLCAGVATVLFMLFLLVQFVKWAWSV